MKQLSMMIDLNRCIGCKTCIVACRNHHEIVDHTTAMPNKIPYYLRVEAREQGIFPNVALDTWVVPCQHCPEPGCRLSCPNSAVIKDTETGVVQIDREKCTGCEYQAAIDPTDKVKPAPCKVACPAGLNVQGYVQLVKQGRYEDAVRLILQRVPFPGVLGRICPHPCEDMCRRREVDEAVSIRELKRLAADRVDFGSLPVPTIKENGGKVAVIGSGPAGMTAAYDLRLMGYEVTVFEAQEVLGGMLRIGIPDYRLPAEVVEREIGYLLRHGIEARTGIHFGTDLSLADLWRQGFQAVLLAIGLHGEARLNIAGEDADGVRDAIRFLREVNLGVRGEVGRRVVIVGGGNVAIDSARTARRLGCSDVTIVYRRTEREMPAYQEELENAKQEGIAFIDLASPVEVIVEGGKVVGLRCIKNELGMPDESGRPRPIPVKGSEFVIKCDTVVSAIGQRMEAPWLKELKMALTSEGTFPVSGQLETMLPKVFAAGDAVRGPSTVIHAIADGHRAAESIHRFLQGLSLELQLGNRETADDAKQYAWKAVPSGLCETVARAKPGFADPEERSTCFLEECKGLSEEQGRREAERCLNCGCCCMQSCPYDVIQFDAQAGTSHKCNLCYDRIVTGEKPVCAEVCLTDAISFGEYELLKQKAIDNDREIIEELSRASLIYVK